MSPLCKIKPFLNLPEWMTSQEADRPNLPASRPAPTSRRRSHPPTQPPWESLKDMSCLCKCCWRTFFRCHPVPRATESKPRAATGVCGRVGGAGRAGGEGMWEGWDVKGGGSECNAACVGPSAGRLVVCRRCVKTACLCWGGVAALGIRGNLYFCNKVITNTLPQGA